MSDAAKEAAWRDEFETAGERQVYETAQGRACGVFPEDKRQFALRWVREKERERDVNGRTTDWYVKWTFWAAIVAAIASVISAVFTVFPRFG